MFNLFDIQLLTLTQVVTVCLPSYCLHLHMRWIWMVIPSFSKCSSIIHANMSWWCRCNCVLAWVERVRILLLPWNFEALMGEIWTRRILNAWIHAKPLGVDGLEGVNLFITGVVISCRIETLLVIYGLFVKSHLLEHLWVRDSLVANSSSISLLSTK